MATDVFERGSVLADERADPRHWYAMFGLRVASDVPLPLPALTGPGGGPPAWVFRMVEPGRAPPAPDGPLLASTPCPTHGFDQMVHRGPGGAWIWHRAIGTCHVRPNARQVDIYAETGTDDSLLALILAGQVSVFVLHQLGYPTLHASAVATPDGAVAFLGPKGQGKSTMAAAFLRRGAELLTDDVLPLHAREDGIYATPSLPIMKLWLEAAECTLGVSDGLQNLAPDYDKKLLSLDGRLPFAQAPVRVRAFYFLDRDAAATEGADVVIRPLSRRDALAGLLAQVSYGAFLRPDEAARLLPFYARLTAQAPVCVVSYPSSFEHQEAVHRAIVADLAGAKP